MALLRSGSPSRKWLADTLSARGLRRQSGLRLIDELLELSRRQAVSRSWLAALYWTPELQAPKRPRRRWPWCCRYGAFITRSTRVRLTPRQALGAEPHRPTLVVRVCVAGVCGRHFNRGRGGLLTSARGVVVVDAAPEEFGQVLLLLCQPAKHGGLGDRAIRRLRTWTPPASDQRLDASAPPAGARLTSARCSSRLTRKVTLEGRPRRSASHVLTTGRARDRAARGVS